MTLISALLNVPNKPDGFASILSVGQVDGEKRGAFSALMDSVLAELAPSDAGPVPDADPAPDAPQDPLAALVAVLQPGQTAQTGHGAEGGAMGAPSVSTPFMPGQVLVPLSEGERADPMAKIPLGAGPEFLPDTAKPLAAMRVALAEAVAPETVTPALPAIPLDRTITPMPSPKTALQLGSALSTVMVSQSMPTKLAVPEKLMAAPALPGQRADAENATANFVSSIARGLGSGQVPKPAANLPIRAIGPAMSAPALPAIAPIAPPLPGPIEAASLPVDTGGAPMAAPVSATPAAVPPAPGALGALGMPLPMFAPDWTAQLIEGPVANLAEAGGGTMVLELAPEELGRMTVSVSVQGDSASVLFAAENPEAARLLSEAQRQLATDLERLGMTLAGHDTAPERRAPQEQGGQPDGHSPSGLGPTDPVLAPAPATRLVNLIA